MRRYCFSVSKAFDTLINTAPSKTFLFKSFLQFSMSDRRASYELKPSL